MAINLQKGQTIDLRKNDRGESVYDLSKVTIGLGWDVRKQGGFFGKLFNKEAEYDLDAVAFLLDGNGKVANLGRTVQTNDGRQIGLYQGDVVFSILCSIQAEMYGLREITEQGPAMVMMNRSL